jgi:hypothetical protein
MIHSQFSREASKRTFLWDLGAAELDLVSLPPPPQAASADIPATKKPRSEEEPCSVSTVKATAKIASAYTALKIFLLLLLLRMMTQMLITQMLNDDNADADNADGHSLKGT